MSAILVAVIETLLSHIVIAVVRMLLV